MDGTPTSVYQCWHCRDTGRFDDGRRCFACWAGYSDDEREQAIHADERNERRLRDRACISPNDPWPSYAWPGGYPVGYGTDDGDILCADCVNDPRNPVHFHPPTYANRGNGWGIVAIDIVEHSEIDVICAHCGHVLYESEDMEWQ